MSDGQQPKLYWVKIERDESNSCVNTVPNKESATHKAEQQDNPKELFGKSIELIRNSQSLFGLNIKKLLIKRLKELASAIGENNAPNNRHPLFNFRHLSSSQINSLETHTYAFILPIANGFPFEKKDLEKHCKTYKDNCFNVMSPTKSVRIRNAILSVAATALATIIVSSIVTAAISSPVGIAFTMGFITTGLALLGYYSYKKLSTLNHHLIESFSKEATTKDIAKVYHPYAGL